MKRFYLIIFGLISVVNASYAFDYSSLHHIVTIDENDVYNNFEALADTLYINNGTITGAISIEGEAVIVNYGSIMGSIVFDDAYDFYLQNYNNIDITGITLNGGTITQNVAGVGDTNIISGLENHVVNVENASLLNMSDLINMAINSSGITIGDSTLIVEPGTPSFDKQIKFNNSVVLYITNINSEISEPLISHIIGTPTMQTIGIDSMFAVTPYISGNALYVDVVRQTNYSLVFDGPLGDYLDSVRDDNPNDKLISELDAAQTRSELNRILSKSVRTKPILLAKPMQIVSNLHEVHAFLNQKSTDMSLTPFYVSSDEFGITGGTIGVAGILYNDLFAKFGVFGGRVNFDGDYDTYNSWLYGGNIDVVYNDDDVYVGANGIISYSDFSDIDVFDGKRVHKNSYGISGHFATDFGPVFKLSDSIKFAPFVGGVFDYAKVSRWTDSDLFGRLGIDATMDTVQDGNKYGFGLRTLVQTDGGVYAMLRSDMLSVVDGVGGEINAGLFYQDSVVSYKFSLDINFVF